MSTTPATTTDKSSGAGITKAPQWPLVVILSTILCIALFFQIKGCFFAKGENNSKGDTTKQNAPTTPPPAPQQQDVKPAVIYATTPRTLTLDYAFNIESDEPIFIQYPGEKPILYKDKCQKLPQPKQAGPKTFTDPDDPSGHRSFRIYPVNLDDVPACPTNN